MHHAQYDAAWKVSVVEVIGQFWLMCPLSLQLLLSRKHRNFLVLENENDVHWFWKTYPLKVLIKLADRDSDWNVKGLARSFDSVT